MRSTREINEDNLWQVQLEHYPRSRRLTSKDLYDWVFNCSSEQTKNRAVQVAHSLQYDQGVWYRTECINEPATDCRPVGGWMGFRYGINGSEYLSGFTNL